MKPLYVIGALAAVALIGTYAALRITTDPGGVLSVTHRTPEEYLATQDVPQLEAEIRVFCSQCHGFPEPNLFPADVWVPEINRALGFARDAGPTEVPKPDERGLTAWYQVHAADRPVDEKPGPIDEDTIFGTPTSGPGLQTSAAVTSQLLQKAGDGLFVLTTDMMTGEIVRTSLSQSVVERIHKGAHPARIRACDLDPACETEYLIANLGTPGVTDDLVGSVVWLREQKGEAGASTFSATMLVDDIGRAADARAADFDGDGDNDVLIAEFGWYRTGSVRLLENTPDGFVSHEIDDRHGAVEIEITDFNADGRLDFLVAFGQEVESIELFTNQGGLSFENRQLFRASTPAFGMSSLELLDADADGDTDLLITSGDMYDTYFIQDHHGVYLLTNDGGEFTPSRVGSQFAAMCTAHGDVDGDGDLDIVVGSFIPAGSDFGSSPAYQAVVFWEQTAPGTYEPRTLKRGDCAHTAINLFDIDADGDLDIVTGTLHDRGGEPEPGLTIWTNALK